MVQKLYVKDIMTAKAVAVKPEDLAVYAATILYQYNFTGLPVVNEDGTVAGVLTEYDLISKGDDMHLPTLINILANIDTYKKDSSLVKDDLQRMMILKVKEVMNKDPLIVEEDLPIARLAELFAQHHRVNPILVVDKSKKLRGVVSRFDVVRFFVNQNVDREVKTSPPQALDQKVTSFIDNFEKKFTNIPPFPAVHPKWWPWLSFLLALVGFSVIFAVLSKITK